MNAEPVKDKRPLFPNGEDIAHFVFVSFLLFLLLMILVSYTCTLINIRDSLSCLLGFIGVISEFYLFVTFGGLYRYKKFKSKFRYYDVE